MIKVKDGMVSMSGNRIELMSELCVLMRSLLDEGVMNKDDLGYCVDLMNKSDSELSDELKRAQSEFILQMWRELGDLL